MSVFVVTYDLRQPRRDYSALYAALSAYAGCSPLESMYLIETDETAGEVLNFLAQYIDENDGLLVAKLSGNWATRRVNNDAVKWLQARFP